MTRDQLQYLVEQMPADEIASFIEMANAIRTRKVGSTLPEHEAALLGKINQAMSPGEYQRYRQLITKRDSESIAEEELEELSVLCDQEEQRTANRLEALILLASLRETTVDQLMLDLGIQAPRDGE